MKILDLVKYIEFDAFIEVWKGYDLLFAGYKDELKRDFDLLDCDVISIKPKNNFFRPELWIEC